MKTICDTKNYRIGFDKEKNSVNILFRGFWASSQILSNYAACLKKLTEQLTPGFTLLFDFSNMRAFPVGQDKVKDEFKSLREKFIPRKVAIVQPQSVIAHFELVSLIDEDLDNYNIPKKIVASVSQAEQWLEKNVSST